jgi:hypothetical protein
MNEPKAFASLSSTLLARKGHAKPAMRPQGFAGFGMAPSAAAQDDLGWNDMGHEREAEPVFTADVVPILPEVAAPVADVAPVQAERPAVLRQQDDLARELAPASAPALVRAPRAAAGSKGKAAFTLRLDPERHLKLRLVCAVAHRSAQHVVAQALDEFLATQPEIAALAATTSQR